MLFAEPVHPYGAFWADIADKIIKGCAVLIGGIWTYRNSFRQKVEATVSGQVYLRGDQQYLIVTSDLRNLGKSKYVIKQRGTAVEVEAIDASGTSVIFVASVFTDHTWIEPDEHIQDSLIRPIPTANASYIALKLNLRVVSRKYTFFGVEWNATRILISDNPNSIQAEGEKQHVKTRAGERSDA